MKELNKFSFMRRLRSILALILVFALLEPSALGVMAYEGDRSEASNVGDVSTVTGPAIVKSMSGNYYVENSEFFIMEFTHGTDKEAVAVGIDIYFKFYDGKEHFRTIPSNKFYTEENMIYIDGDYLNQYLRTARFCVQVTFSDGSVSGEDGNIELNVIGRDNPAKNDYEGSGMYVDRNAETIIVSFPSYYDTLHFLYLGENLIDPSQYRFTHDGRYIIINAPEVFDLFDYDTYIPVYMLISYYNEEYSEKRIIGSNNTIYRSSKEEGDSNVYFVLHNENEEKYHRVIVEPVGKTHVVIPSSINGIPVTTVDWRDHSIESIRIPDSVTAINGAGLVPNAKIIASEGSFAHQFAIRTGNSFEAIVAEDTPSLEVPSYKYSKDIESGITILVTLPKGATSVSQLFVGDLRISFDGNIYYMPGYVPVSGIDQVPVQYLDNTFTYVEESKEVLMSSALLRFLYEYTNKDLYVEAWVGNDYDTYPIALLCREAEPVENKPVIFNPEVPDDVTITINNSADKTLDIDHLIIDRFKVDKSGAIEEIVQTMKFFAAQGVLGSSVLFVENPFTFDKATGALVINKDVFAALNLPENTKIDISVAMSDGSIIEKVATLEVTKEVDTEEPPVVEPTPVTPTPSYSGGSSAVAITPTPTQVPEVVEFKGTEVTSTKTIYVGNTSVLNKADNEYEDTKISYSSSDTSIVTVTKDGKIKGIKPGKAIITATYNVGKFEFKHNTEVTVKVNKGKATTKTLSTLEVKGDVITITFNRDLKVGKSLDVTLQGYSDNSIVVYSTANKNKATIEDGIVKGLSTGKVKITSLVKDNKAGKTIVYITNVNIVK